MPPALDRLLASPSALRLLRSIVNASERPTAFPATANCCASRTSHRTHSSHGDEFFQQKWRRWHDSSTYAAHQEKERQLFEWDTLKRDSDNPDTSIEIWTRDGDAAWAATLARQERLNWMQGIKKTWKACRFQGYRLPTDDTLSAEFLWGTFIKHEKLAKKVIDHAAELLQETNKLYPQLYSLIMRYWLPREPERASEYHHHMLVTLRLRKLPLRDLARQGRKTFNLATYKAFLEIYRTSNERDLYDEVVPALVASGHVTMAQRWHILCTFRKDLPSESVASNPAIKLLSIAEAATSSDARFRNDSHVSKKARQLKLEHAKYNTELMRRLQGRDTAPVRFEDAFCARMFATRTFPPASIIQGLALVGVNEIGPQALLAMGLRTEPIEELPMRFHELRAAGIALQGSVFSLALEKFAMEKRWHLVRGLLDSDQHPDTFGDAGVQRELLEYYLGSADFAHVHCTLAMLTLFYNDTSSESWNILLQAYIKQSGHQHVMKTLRDMRTLGVPITQESVIAIKSLLRSRQRGRKPGLPTIDKFDDLRFVSRAFIIILESGLGYIAPLKWREIVRRFGMSGRIRELRRLLLWMVCWYAPRSPHQFTKLPKSPFLDPATKKLRALHPDRSHYFYFHTGTSQRDSLLHPIRQLFQPSLLQGIIIWGFRAGLLPNAHLEQPLYGPTLGKKHYRRYLFQKGVLRRLNWDTGLRLVVQLRDLGVHVHRHTVVKALQMQFVVMFGRRLSAIIENRLMESLNTIAYAKYVQQVNKIWGSKLFREPQLFKKGMVHDHLWHPRSTRKTNRKTTINLKEILGPNWRDRDEGEAGTGRAGKEDLVKLVKHFKWQSRAMDSDSNSTWSLGPVVRDRGAVEGEIEPDPTSVARSITASPDAVDSV